MISTVNEFWAMGGSLKFVMNFKANDFIMHFPKMEKKIIFGVLELESVGRACFVIEAFKKSNLLPHSIAEHCPTSFHKTGRHF